MLLTNHLILKFPCQAADVHLIVRKISDLFALHTCYS